MGLGKRSEVLDAVHLVTVLQVELQEDAVLVVRYPDAVLDPNDTVSATVGEGIVCSTVQSEIRTLLTVSWRRVISHTMPSSYWSYSIPWVPSSPGRGCRDTIRPEAGSTRKISPSCAAVSRDVR